MYLQGKENKKQEKIKKLKKLLTNQTKDVIINTTNEREEKIMTNITIAYNNYISAMADPTVSVDTLEALYNEWVSLKVAAEGRD